MSYCVAIKVKDGLVFASDSRTNAGVDHVSVYSKMHAFGTPGDRVFVVLTAGNLATSQAVINLIRRDLEDREAEQSLDTVQYLFDAAHYVGELSVQVQNQHAEMFEKTGGKPEASFILGGQIKGGMPEIFLIYPEGNYISASEDTPYLQIGENKYGKPILDRIITPQTSLEDAGRCALVSLDSTMRANVSVGPPLELAIYNKDSFELGRRMTLKLASPFYKTLQKRWNEGLKRAFNRLPRFDWE
jgi:putative proteasome-type protease